MVDRELEFKVTAAPDSNSFAATKKEFREAAKEMDKARAPVEKLNDEFEKLSTLQKKGLISEDTAARRRGQLRAGVFRERLNDVGLGQFGTLLGVRGPLVGALAALTGVMTGFVQLMKTRAGEVATAEELGVAPKEFSGLRRALGRLDISTEARNRAARAIGERAFGQRISLQQAAQQIRDQLLRIRDPASRARVAEGLGLGREFGREGVLQPDTFDRLPRALTPQQERVIRFFRRLGRREIDEFMPEVPQGVPDGAQRGVPQGRGVRAAERELGALFNDRRPLRVIVEGEGVVDQIE
jgi:ribosomal protein S20